MATISDRKLGVENNGSIAYYRAEVLSSQDYYAFGMLMPGRTYSGAAKFKYGFNGKENDNEVKGEGNQQDYGMRIYDPRLGKFLSVDPIKNKYPNLSSYQFGSNTPIQAIDLDGLEAFFIHGTASSPDERWIQSRNDDGSAKSYYKNVAVLMQLTDNKTINAQFEWTNDHATNTQTDRRSAAEKLAQHVINNMVDGEDVTLIGHSHGGNVAIQASGMIRDALDKLDKGSVKINIITIATPAYNTTEKKFGNDSENPSKKPIDNHLHIYNTQDVVQTKMANSVGYKKASRFYTNDKTVNYKINVSSYYGSNSIGAHSFDFENPQILQFNIEIGSLKKVSDQTAPKNGGTPDKIPMDKFIKTGSKQ